MKSSQLLGYIFLATFFALAGCSTNDNPDKVKRTYPQALNLRTVSVQKVIDKEVSPPDSTNLNAYVVSINVCPDRQNCIVPDGISIADSLNTDPSNWFHLTITNPHQFIKDQQYTISLQLARRSPISDIIDVNLLGYSRLQNDN